MLLFPTRQKTLVSAFSKEEVIRKIAGRTQILHSEILTPKPSFNGHFDKDTFRLSPAVNYSQNYLPLVRGRVENTSRGSILFLRLSLFPAAKLYLIAFSALSLFIGLVFLLMARSPVAGVIALVIGALNYLLLTINFQRKANETISVLEALLEA